MEYAGKRLDQTLTLIFPDYSRERLKAWIISGECLVNGEMWQPKTKVAGGECVVIAVAEVMGSGAIGNAMDNTAIACPGFWQPQNLAEKLDILYEDAAIIVINKPAGLVVHPGSGNADHTLVNTLLFYAPALANIPRAGIVHRLDKDTSGLMVVAKTLASHNNLIKQLKTKSVQRIYEAVVSGVMIAGGVVDAPIARHPRGRVKMAVVEGGRRAVTHYRVLEKFCAHTHVRVQLETGRTHQIRVHMAFIKHPVVGDKTYGGRASVPKGASAELLAALRAFPRQALHAKLLGLVHPVSGEHMQWEVALPDDMQRLLGCLRAK